MKLNSSGYSEALAKIGKIKEAISTENNSPLQLLVVRIAKKIIEDLKLSGIESGMDANSLLLASIGGSEFLTVEGSKIKVSISANEYWDFVNSGVNGLKANQGSQYSFKTPYPNKKMALSLKEGMRTKGLSLPPGFKDYDSYSYAAATKIKRDGIKANKFVDKVLTPDFINKISLSLAKELGREIQLSIKVN